MSAIVIPFPRAHDRRFVCRHAAHMANARTAQKAEEHLQRQLTVQRQAMERRGVAPARIASELTALEGNIRAAVWKLLLAPGRPA